MAIKLTLLATGTFSKEWPKIEFFVNGGSAGIAEIQETTEIDYTLDLNLETNKLEIKYFGKTEQNTVVDENNNIIADQSVKLHGVRINDILLDDWFINKSVYYPDYSAFPGFLNAVDNPETECISQLNWFFPGTFVFKEMPPAEDKLWFWYRDKRRYVYNKKYEGKDGLREENYIGSFDPCNDLITEIKALLDNV